MGIRSLAMPFLNCLHGQRAGEDSPTQQRREGGGGGRGGTGAHFLTIPAAPGCLPSRGHPLDMESGVPQPTLSQVLTNPSTPAGGRGASVVPQPLVGSGTQGVRAPLLSPGGPRLGSYVGGGEGGGRNPGKVASVLRGGRGPAAEPPPQHQDTLPTHTPRPPAGAEAVPRRPSGVSTVPAYSTASPVQVSPALSPHGGNGRRAARGLLLCSWPRADFYRGGAPRRHLTLLLVPSR